MSKSKARFKKLDDDSKILGVGSLFRVVGRKGWAINIDLTGKKPQSMQFSNIPVLARKRVLNPTLVAKPAGLPIEFIIGSAQEWEVAKASDCPAFNAHHHGNDGNQNCFVVNVDGKRVFIPQLEMARVLFYHDPFLARLSLQHDALSEDFMLSKRDDGQPLIVVREGAEYPVSYFNRDDNRRFLSWVLLDSDARTSFESIGKDLTLNQYQKGSYLHWNFQFSPPSLSGVQLGARGWADNVSNSFFVWEIKLLDNLPSEVEGEIDFYHPGYERKLGGKPTKGDGKQGQAPDEFDLDDDELSDSDKATLALNSEQVSVSFRNPHITNRVAQNTKAVNNLIGDGDKEVLDKDLSPNEKEESGALPGGAWNNLDDQTDDAHLYIGKFKSFFSAIELLTSKHGCRKVSDRLVKLPKVGDGKKHWLNDKQNPRCIAIVELEHGGKSYTILEIDTSDGAAKLSTMLLTSPLGWVANNEKVILQRIMKKSLGWPSDYFKGQLGEGANKGIPHPESKHPGSLPPESLDPWAQRIANWIKRSA
ncbi:Tn7-like element transposition protein TnsE [Paraglaciecola sp.]|uniref:Tn7-like element transposition protein TnsE n=1 Tax=Paraglaciecola sp. TaxID=1920173 RepID=UPI00273D14BF|nr:Tn7-like element transposition protein TnsE [Paraglaciecola sp.]MDP5032496.1 Tn7-like element transposition protein TnsE [Paraglaciecola sp.]